MCMRRIRETEQQLGLENVPPVEALVRLVRWSVRISRHPRGLYAGDLHGEYAARQVSYKPRVN